MSELLKARGVRLCRLDDVRVGEMTSFMVEDREIIVVWPIGGSGPKAYDVACPHQQLPLADGDFDGRLIVCAAHKWRFDAETGEGMHPIRCNLTAYPLRIEDDEIVIDLLR